MLENEIRLVWIFVHVISHFGQCGQGKFELIVLARAQENNADITPDRAHFLQCVSIDKQRY